MRDFRIGARSPSAKALGYFQRNLRWAISSGIFAGLFPAESSRGYFQRNSPFFASPPSHYARSGFPIDGEVRAITLGNAMGLIRNIFWLVLFLFATLCFVVLFEKGTAHFVPNVQKQIVEFTRAVQEQIARPAKTPKP